MERWATFAGFVLVVAVVYWAQPVLIPLAIAALISFVLSAPVGYLQRWIGRVPAILLVVALVSSLLALATWGVATQITQLAADLPGYSQNIRQKIADLRRAGGSGTLGQVQETLESLQQELEQSAPGETSATKGTPQRPVVVQPEQTSALWAFPAWVSPVLAPLSTAGLVVVLVVFMLVEREELRGRLIGLLGSGNLAVTTKAFDEASRRVSRQLAMQTLVNTIYGVAVGVGLWAIGVPYPLTWGALCAALRFIPYVGPIVAAVVPILMSLAALPGWTPALWTAALFAGLELFTNMVLETVLYAGAAGISQVALLVAVASWTWLWGSMGLLLATPLTVCLVVLGKHVPGLEFLSTLMADSPALTPDVVYYQRLLARDQSEAADLITRHVAAQSLPSAESAPQAAAPSSLVAHTSVYDALLIPALNFAERDRVEGRLSDAEEVHVIEESRELMADVANAVGPLVSSGVETVASVTGSEAQRVRTPLRVIGLAANGPADELALRMLAQWLDFDPDSGIVLDIGSSRLLSADLVTLARESREPVVCIADLPPSPASKTRYVVRKLRRAVPDAIILVGRWAPAGFVEDDTESLVAAGATHVATSLAATYEQLKAVRDAAGRDVAAPSRDDRGPQAA